MDRRPPPHEMDQLGPSEAPGRLTLAESQHPPKQARMPHDARVSLFFHELFNSCSLTLTHPHTLPPLTRDLSLVAIPRIPVFGRTANAAIPDSSPATPNALGLT